MLIFVRSMLLFREETIYETTNIKMIFIGISLRRYAKFNEKRNTAQRGFPILSAIIKNQANNAIVFFILTKFKRQKIGKYWLNKKNLVCIIAKLKHKKFTN